MIVDWMNAYYNLSMVISCLVYFFVMLAVLVMSIKPASRRKVD
jgi:hypothetical protein